MQPDSVQLLSDEEEEIIVCHLCVALDAMYKRFFAESCVIFKMLFLNYILYHSTWQYNDVIA